MSRAAPSGGGWRRCRLSAPRGEEPGPALTSSPAPSHAHLWSLVSTRESHPVHLDLKLAPPTHQKCSLWTLHSPPLGVRVPPGGPERGGLGIPTLCVRACLGAWLQCRLPASQACPCRGRERKACECQRQDRTSPNPLTRSGHTHGHPHKDAQTEGPGARESGLSLRDVGTRCWPGASTPPSRPPSLCTQHWLRPLSQGGHGGSL